MFRAFIDCSNGFACVSLSLSDIRPHVTDGNQASPSPLYLMVSISS